MYRSIATAVLIALTLGCDTETDDGGGDGAAPGQPDAGSVEQCEAHSQCDDGVYCNGEERCTPGDPGADPRGCVLGGGRCMPSQTCDEVNRRCVADCGVERDADGDGHESTDCGGDDCDDADADRYPGNAERCDDRDQDCDDGTLAGPGGDADGDGYVSSACCAPVAGGTRCGPDCDDALSDVRPGVADACGNGDEDCDSSVDENPTLTVYPDADSDGFGVSDGATLACFALPGYALSDGDCDDTRASVHPAAAEICNGRDDDCNDAVDDAELGCECTDGTRRPCGTTEVGDCQLGVQTCVGGRWGACDGEVLPRDEVCGGGDEDCDGATDEEGALGGDVFYADADSDGFGNFYAPIRACTAPAGYVVDASDCNDFSADAYPGATGRYSTPACRNGATPHISLCPGEPIGGNTCWYCGTRVSSELDYDFNCDGGATPDFYFTLFCVPGVGTVAAPAEPQHASMCGREVEYRVCTRDFASCTCGTELRRLLCQ